MDPAIAPEHPRNIALCLSGGGLRATFFHLGVIEALHRCGRLKEVSEVFSVSGGSITAAHLALNWKRYTGSEEDFRQAADELRAIGEWDIRGRVLRRWILSCAFVLPRLLGYGRTRLLQGQYERMTRGRRLCDIGPQSTGGPRFYFLATSFNTGNLCSFSDDAFTLHHLEDHRSSRARQGNGKLPPAQSYASGNIRLSLAITASSAFPPMFPPVELGWEQIGGASQSGFNAIALTDGGVYDNLGLDTFLALADRDGRSIDTVVVSDAGGTFSASIKNEFDGPISRNVRATDILMYRTAQATLKRIDALPAGIRGVDISIAAQSPLSRLSKTAQSRLQSIRTDLDAFTEREVDLLVEHGRGVARNALLDEKLCARDPQAEEGQPAADIEPPDKPDFQSELYEQAASHARKRRIGLLNTRDWTSEVLVAIAVLAFIAAGYIARTTYDQIVVIEKGDFQSIADLADQAEGLQKDKEALQKQLGTLSMQVAQLTERQRPSADPTRPPASVPDDPPTTPDSFDRRPYTVWIQFAGSLTRDQMKTFGQDILAKGWKAPGAAQGGERTPRANRQNEIRHNPETDAKAVAQLVDDVNKSGITSTKVVGKPVAIIPKNSLEVWISN
jgi:predicted acylesterase/phospholipase RssA